MAQHGAHDDLPITWPFRAAATLGLLAMIWLCLHFALEDVGTELDSYWPILWTLLVSTVALCALGAVVNVARERKRAAS